MKYFDILPASVEDELIKRGVSVNRLLYCAKADMDGEGCYLDMYLAFDSEALYILRGYEIYERLTKSRKKAKQLCRYKTEGFEEILIDTIDMMYVDRYQNTARLMIQDNKEGEKLLMAAINLIGKLLNMISGLILANVVPTVTHRLRCKIFTAMQTLSLPFFTSKQTGSLMTRVDNDSENIYWFFVDIVPYGLMNFAKIIGIAAIMFMLSPLLSIGIFAIIIVIEVVQSRFYKTQRKLYRKLHIATRAGTAVLSDALNGERVVKAFAKEDQETKRYDEKNNEMFRIDSAINNRIADTVPTLWMFCRLVSYLLGIVGVLLIIDGKLEFGVLTALLSYTNMIYDPINFFTWIGNRFANCIDAASRMFEILDSTPTVKESDHPIHIDSMKGDIKLKNVSFEYEAGRPIIKDVSFQVEAGQMFGIVGKTGAGKSTIINLIARLYDVTGGEILIDGIPVKNIAVKDLRKNIGIVSQETYLFMGSIADNIRYARPEATMEEVISAAKAAYAHEFITKLPDGYNTRIGSGAVNLSGGERQRISIARAIIQKPNILILDEATASMDTRTERKIQVAISELKKGRTIISIAHRLSTLRDADMLCVIENGELKEMGTHDELIHKKGKYFDLYRLQADALKFIGFDEDKLMNTYQIAEYDEIFCEELVGCSMLVGRKGKKYRFFCAFTQTYFIRYAEVCKLIEHYKRTGEWITDTKEEEPICPKCGLPLDGATVCPYCAKKSDYLLRLIKRTAPYKGYFVAALICTIITELIWVIMPYLQRIMIDDYVTTGRKADSKLAFLGIATIGLVLVAWILEHINMKASCKVALSVGRDLRSDIFAKTQQMSMASVSKRTAGELINRIRRDAMRLQDFITANGKDAIVKLFSLIILGIMLFVMNYKLALLVILPVPAVVFCVSKLFHVMSIRYGRVWRLRSRYSSILHDILNGIRVVKSYGNEEHEIAKYTKASEKWMKSAINAEVVWNLVIPLAGYLLTIGNFLVLYAGGKMVLKEQISLGELVQYTSYVSMIYGPLTWMMEIPRLLADTAVSASRVFEILDEIPDVKDKKNAMQLTVKGDISFEDVYFGYQVYKPVLKGISCDIHKGEMIGIVGHSGVGKSTMINLILRLYDCTGGSIKIDGVDIRDISQESLRRQVGVVLQETFLFDGSIYDNIRYSKPEATFEEIIRAAKVANAHSFITKLPDGYNTRVGNKGYTLSGGERQRIAIARAILHDPKILILDEATASLDTQTEKQIQEALNRLTKGRTTIAIAHRLSTLSNADRLIVLDQGKLAEMGTHNELMRNKGVYYKLVMAQRQTTKMKKAEAVS